MDTALRVGVFSKVWEWLLSVSACTWGSVERQVAEVAPFDDLDGEAAGGGVVGQTEEHLRNSAVRERLGGGGTVRRSAYTQLSV